MSKEKEIVCMRGWYSAQSTLGELIHPDTCERWCYTLEDTVRPDTIKVYKHTAIPALRYRVAVTPSPRFGRDMILLYNTEQYNIVHKGVQFDGVRVHGGNDHTNTEGCPLVAYNSIGKKEDSFRIQGTAEKDITEQVKQWIEEGYEVYWKVVNCPQEK